MATNLTDIIKKVRTALRGEEVRGSIADGLEYCGQISENAKADMEATAAATKEQLSKDIDAKAAATKEQLSKDIDAKAAETLKSIPESYTELDGSVKQLKEDIVSLNINLIDVNSLDIGKQINKVGDHDKYKASAYYCTGKIKILTGVQYVLNYPSRIEARFVVRTENDTVKTVFSYSEAPDFVYINNGSLYITVPADKYDNNKYVYVDFTGHITEKNKAFFALNTANDERLENLINENKKEIDNINLSVPTAKYDTIKCIGDSQTGGSGNFTPYPTILHDTYLQSKNILNYGNGGENVNAICYRCGTLGLIVKPFTLPADTSQVTVESYFENGSEKGNLFSAWNHSNPVTIDGIQCYMRSKGTIARVNSTQNETIFSRPVYALPPDPINKEHFYILLMGQNGGFDSVDEYLNDCYKCASKTSKYIIMLPYTESFLSKVKVTYDELLKKACSIFGKNVFNIKKYLIEYGLDDNNLTATETDNTDISNGHVPHQLYADYDIHLNQYGLNAQAKGVYLFGKYNGYWS